MDPTISPAEQAARDELSAYTLTHGDPEFIHQHVVDAFAAQHATAKSSAIGVAFALIGLYLRVSWGLMAAWTGPRLRCGWLFPLLALCTGRPSGRVPLRVAV